MSKINKLRGLLEFGGLNLVLFKVEDKLFHGHSGQDYIYKVLENADPEEYPQLLKSMWKMYAGTPLDLDNPKSFNEKIWWTKIFDATPYKTRLVDKYLVRDWIKERIGKEYLVPIIGVWNQFDDIDFTKLPKRFALKCNHYHNFLQVIC